MGAVQVNWTLVMSGLALLVSAGSLAFSIHVWRANRENAKHQSRATGLELFLMAFAMRDKNAEDYAENLTRCAKLYAHLAANGGDVKRAKYITTAACAFFHKRDTANTNERKLFADARSAVEEHLRFQDRPWTVPTSGPIYEWAGAIRQNLHNPAWLVETV